MDQGVAENLDEIILEEKKLVAREHFLDAWEAGLTDGIDADIFARELISGALLELTRLQGASTANQLISEISDKELNGAFLPFRPIH